MALECDLDGTRLAPLVHEEEGELVSGEAGAEAAAKIGELVSTNIIPSAHQEVFELIGVNK